MLVNESKEQHCLSFKYVLGLWVETFFKQEFQALEHLGLVRIWLMILALCSNADFKYGNALICDKLKSSFLYSILYLFCFNFGRVGFILWWRR